MLSRFWERYQADVISGLVVVLLVAFAVTGVTMGYAGGAGNVYERASRTVVLVNILDGQGGVSAHGSGVIISANGLVLTAAHVARDRTTELEVVLADGRKFRAEVVEVGGDNTEDAALIKIVGGDNLPYSRVSKAPLEVGERVFAVGNPFSWHGVITWGRVFGPRYSFEDNGQKGMIATNLAFWPGSSGGGLFDEDGLLVGITVIGALFYHPGSQSQGPIALTFSVPIANACRIAKVC